MYPIRADDATGGGSGLGGSGTGEAPSGDGTEGIMVLWGPSKTLVDGPLKYNYEEAVRNDLSPLPAATGLVSLGTMDAMLDKVVAKNVGIFGKLTIGAHYVPADGPAYIAMGNKMSPGSMPYIDFNFGHEITAQPYSARLIASTNKYLGVLFPSAGGRFHVEGAGTALTQAGIGWSPWAGNAVHMGMDSNIGRIYSHDYSTATWRDLTIAGKDIRLSPQFSGLVRVQGGFEVTGISHLTNVNAQVINVTNSITVAGNPVSSVVISTLDPIAPGVPGQLWCKVASSI